MPQLECVSRVLGTFPTTAMSCSVSLTQILDCPDEGLQKAFSGADVECMQEALARVLGRPVSVQKGSSGSGWVMQCPSDEIAALRKIFVVTTLPHAGDGMDGQDGKASAAATETEAVDAKDAEQLVQFSVHFTEQHRFRNRADVQRLLSHHVPFGCNCCIRVSSSPQQCANACDRDLRMPATFAS